MSSSEVSHPVRLTWMVQLLHSDPSFPDMTEILSYKQFFGINEKITSRLRAGFLDVQIFCLWYTYITF